MKRTSILLAVPILLSASLARADLPFADDFNRPDGPFVGNGWGSWGGSVGLDNGWVYAGADNNGQGIMRDDLLFPATVPMTFDFDFAQNDVGGWAVQINTTNPELGNFDNQPRLLALMQHRGEEGVRLRVGENLYGGWQYSDNAREWVGGETVHINGLIFPDLSIQVTVDYLDGGPQAIYEWASQGVDPLSIPQGNLFSIGNANDLGQSRFDNLFVAPEPATAILLGAAGLLALRRYRHRAA